MMVLLPGAMLAQQVERYAIGVNGGFAQAGTYTATHGMGEPLTPTGHQGTLWLTQGVVQPDQLAGATQNVRVEQPPVAVTYAIYPNPTEDQLHLRFEGREPVSLTLSLHDQTGRLIPNFGATIPLDGYVERVWDLSPLAAGVYYLRMSQHDGREVKAIKVWKKG
jgi:hypothetical protein